MLLFEPGKGMPDRAIGGNLCTDPLLELVEARPEVRNRGIEALQFARRIFAFKHVVTGIDLAGAAAAARQPCRAGHSRQDWP